MSDFIFIVVALCCLFFLPLLGGWLRWKLRLRRYQEERDKVVPVDDKPRFGDFSGLGDEVVWKGKLPDRVNDYVKPRYVYENGVEKRKHDPLQGRVIGYRISPTLVIHSMVGGNKNWTMLDAIAFKEHYVGEFLDADDILILRKNWDRVSKMREVIGDTPLPAAWFWANDGANLKACHYRKEAWADIKKCNVILKR